MSFNGRYETSSDIPQFRLPDGTDSLSSCSNQCIPNWYSFKNSWSFFLRFLLYLILLYFYFSYNNPQVQMLPLKSYSCSCLFFVARVLQWERVGALHYAKGWRCASVGKCEYEIFHTYFTPPPPPPQIHTQNKPTHITCIILGHCRSLQRWFTASLLKNFKILLDWLQSDSQALRSVFRLQHMII